MASESDKQWLSDVPNTSPMWGGHNGPSGPMPETTVIDISKASEQKMHMTEKGKAMYEMFCAARAETRATAEGVTNAAEFFEVGKEQGEKVLQLIKENQKEKEE
jgi:hypothetical protein